MWLFLPAVSWIRIPRGIWKIVIGLLILRQDDGDGAILAKMSVMQATKGQPESNEEPVWEVVSCII